MTAETKYVVGQLIYRVGSQGITIYEVTKVTEKTLATKRVGGKTYDTFRVSQSQINPISRSVLFGVWLTDAQEAADLATGYFEGETKRLNEKIKDLKLFTEEYKVQMRKLN